MHDRSSLILAVDIGGSKVASGFVDSDGNASHIGKFMWDSYETLHVLERLSETVRRLLSAAPRQPDAIGFTIPGLAPAIKINFVTSTISGLKILDLILSTTNGGPAHQTETILSLMFSKFSEGNYGSAAAFGMVFLVVSMLVAAVMLGLSKKWEDRLG